MSRVLFVAWQDPNARGIYPVARLTVRDGSPRYEFSYVRGVEDARQVGFVPFTRMTKLDAVYFADELFPVLANRLMPATRPDYDSYLDRLGLQGDPAPVSVLARSEGRKPTDNLELFAPPERLGERWVYHAFARGVRHVPDAEQHIVALQANDPLTIEHEPDNAWDPGALAIRTTARAKVGWVPNTLIEDLGLLLDRVGLDAHVVRVNAPPAPVHQRLLIRVDAKHLDGFVPLSTRRYEVLASDGAVVADAMKRARAEL